MGNVGKWLKAYFRRPRALWCNGPLGDHVWGKPAPGRIFPKCTKCGKECRWLRGYTMHSGTTLGPDPEALKLADGAKLDEWGIPWNSRP